MQLRMWTYDLAREQAPTLDHLRRFMDITREGGFTAIGLYLEHRFAYPSTPWSHGQGCLTPEMVSTLEAEYPDIQIVPFINLLGHFEGMLYTEEGKAFREERFSGMQACPSCPAFLELCDGIIDDTLTAFSSSLIHIGGDETAQLARCPLCQFRADASDADGKATLYGEHFQRMARRVVGAGRRAAVWGDMFVEHPTALAFLPKGTLIFDWQYFRSPLESSRKFVDEGFEVVCCPAIQTYNAIWCHLPQSEQNVRDAVSAAHQLNAYGVCVTTWEMGLFGNYETLLPAIRASGKLIRESESAPSHDETGAYQTLTDAPAFLAEYARESTDYLAWARMMGIELQKLGGPFAYSHTRSSLKCRLLLYSNPFLAWLYHGEELSGEMGEKAMWIGAESSFVAPNVNARGVSQFLLKAIEFVRLAEKARLAYAERKPGGATSALAPGRQVFDALESVAKATQLNAGGSLADPERCRAAREHIERVIRRIKEYGDGHLGYLPAFEIITHPKFVPHDQASWWLINRWANE